MTYRSDGDSTGEPDGYPGSLYSVSRRADSLVSEFSIPAPVISANKDPSELPVATTLQPFTELTGGQQNPSLTDRTLCDIQYMPKLGMQTTDKLYWVMYTYYIPPQDQLTLGWVDPDFDNLTPRGIWRFGEYPSGATSRYLFDIPSDWADAYVDSEYLAAGRYRSMNGGSHGPALYAAAPWNSGNPPADGAAVETTELLHYGSSITLRNLSGADDWADGSWLTADNRSAVIIAGTKGFRTKASGDETYGQPQPDEVGYKGYHANPYFGTMLFYDPHLLAQVAKGNITSEEIQPYAVLNAHNILFNSNKDLACSEPRGRGTGIGGVAFDRARSLFYVLEPGVEGYYSPGKPIVHVFHVRGSGSKTDTTPPTKPTNLRTVSVAADEVTLQWDISTDSSNIAAYIVYRNGHPIDPSIETSYTDSRINPNSVVEYVVAALDTYNNLSSRSDPLVVTTPTGSDTKIPLIADFHITDITNNGATIHWRTDEPATTRIDYKIEYASTTDGQYSDTALTRNHQAVLTELPPTSDIQRYELHIISVDATGNENRYHERNFEPSRPGKDNFAPVLSGIGAKRIRPGAMLQLFLTADDLDRQDTLVFSADDLPSGAVFHHERREFIWTPGNHDIGVHRVTFSVSDGDQTDSEVVSIIVPETVEPPNPRPSAVKNLRIISTMD